MVASEYGQDFDLILVQNYIFVAGKDTFLATLVALHLTPVDEVSACNLY